MQNIGIIEASGNGVASIAAINNRVTGNNPLLRVVGKNKASNHVPKTAPIKSVVNDITDEDIDKQAVVLEFDEDQYGDLRVRFVAALTDHCKALLPLTAIVTEMIGAEIEREEAIDWGIEAGLSESYVRSTVSSLYIQLTGSRKKAVGGGRKRNVSAPGFAEMAMTACKDDITAAKALLLAARRLLEAWEKAGTVERELGNIRNPAK
jgi:hypothetical protein